MKEQTNQSQQETTYGKNVAFRLDQEMYDRVTEEMIARKEFNRSAVVREIFIMGYKQFFKNK